jgi:hypothetical protein
MIHSVIICDGCGDEAQTPGTVYGRWRAHVARNELKELGWTVGKHGTDWCPSCRRLPSEEQQQTED